MGQLEKQNTIVFGDGKK